MNEAAKTEWTKSIGAITLFVEYLDQAEAFYRDVFDLPIAYEDENSAVLNFQDVSINLLITPAVHELIDPALVASRDAGSRFQFTIGVDDVDAVCADLLCRPRGERRDATERSHGPSVRHTHRQFY